MAPWEVASIELYSHLRIFNTWLLSIQTTWESTRSYLCCHVSYFLYASNAWVLACNLILYRKRDRHRLGWFLENEIQCFTGQNQSIFLILETLALLEIFSGMVCNGCIVSLSNYAFLLFRSKNQARPDNMFYLPGISSDIAIFTAIRVSWASHLIIHSLKFQYGKNSCKNPSAALNFNIYHQANRSKNVALCIKSVEGLRSCKGNPTFFLRQSRQSKLSKLGLGFQKGCRHAANKEARSKPELEEEKGNKCTQKQTTKA